VEAGRVVVAAGIQGDRLYMSQGPEQSIPKDTPKGVLASI
jgi:hypothetical protein